MCPNAYLGSLLSLQTAHQAALVVHVSLLAADGCTAGTYGSTCAFSAKAPDILHGAVLMVTRLQPHT